MNEFNRYNARKVNSFNKHMVRFDMPKILLKNFQKEKNEIIDDIASKYKAEITFQRDKYYENVYIMYIDPATKCKLKKILTDIADWIEINCRMPTESKKINLMELIKKPCVDLPKKQDKLKNRKLLLIYLVRWKTNISDKKSIEERAISIFHHNPSLMESAKIEVLDDIELDESINDYIKENCGGYSIKGDVSTQEKQKRSKNRGFAHRRKVRNGDKRIKRAAVVDFFEKDLIVKANEDNSMRYENIDVDDYRLILDELLDGSQVGIIIKLEGSNINIVSLDISSKRVSLSKARASGTMKNKKNRKKCEFMLSDTTPTLVLVSTLGSYSHKDYYIESKIDALLIYYLIYEAHINTEMILTLIDMIYEAKEKTREDYDIEFDDTATGLQEIEDDDSDIFIETRRDMLPRDLCSYFKKHVNMVYNPE